MSMGEIVGVLDYSKLSFVSTMILKLYLVILRLRDKDKSVGKEGDYRDWDAIRSWVESIDFG